MATICPGNIKSVMIAGEGYDYSFEHVFNLTMANDFRGGVQVSFEASNGLMKKQGDAPIEKGTPKVTKKVSDVRTRDCVFPRVGGYPVLAATPGYAKIPWAKGTLTLIAQSPDGQLHYAKTLEEKKEFAFGNFVWILVCWPGTYSQDIFIIDDMKAFRKALGFKKKSTTVLIDEDGEEWT